MSLAIFQTVGPLELLIVLGIVLLIFGPKRLPGLGRSLGAGMREFKDSIGGKADEDGETRALGHPEHDTTTASTADEAVPEKR
jgi:sec-independent protein translocase protein TatA